MLCAGATRVLDGERMRARICSLCFGVWITACASESPAASGSGTSEATPSAARPQAGGATQANAPSPTADMGAAVTSSSSIAGTRAGQALAGTTAAARPSAASGSGARPAAGANAGQAQAGATVGAGPSTTAPAGSAGSTTSTAGQGTPPRAAGQGGQASSGGAPLYRVPLRVHIQASKLTDAELNPIFSELNRIWQEQAGICFDIEVTTGEDNRADGFDFRYTSGRIPGASSANGLTQNAHAIWSIDHPQLNAAPHPVMLPAARTTAHELGHALGLAHENPPPSTDCEKPCHCAERGDNCDDYLLRSGTKGFFLSPPEIETARQHAVKAGKSADAATSCSTPVFMR
jgi:hypothetical protein